MRENSHSHLDICSHKIEVLVCHLRDGALDAMIQQNVVKFSTGTYKISISSGPEQPLMTFSVRPFVPASEDFLIVQCFNDTQFDLESTKLVHRYAFPLALPTDNEVQLKSLRRIFSQHISSIIAQSHFLDKSRLSSSSAIPWKILSAIERYIQSGKGHKQVGCSTIMTDSL